ncbi:MAG: fibronectin/fibrinogen-binding protein [Lachnospiraceae bacterium]|nr:fibronectin/fibrinogen-binding protein [Lachnospiraceae bacterium]
MAFDGICVAAVTEELNKTLVGGRIYKIAQPEPDELLITVKNNGNQYKLFLSADASLPLVYLTEISKVSPLTAPNFCMLLRKYLQSAKILRFYQPGMERIIRMELEHLDELGDIRQKTLVIEIMGKHSNIILLDEKEMIIDSIKHISGMVSSLREVLPGREYFIPVTAEKADPLLETAEDFKPHMKANGNLPVYKAIYMGYTGLSPMMANAFCEEAGILQQQDVESLSEQEWESLWQVFAKKMYLVKSGQFTPCIFYEDGAPAEFSAIEIKSQYEKTEPAEGISALLQAYYSKKNQIVRIRQKSGDLRRTLQSVISRTAKKYDLQCAQLKDTEKKEQYRIYGELLNTYGYNIKEGEKTLEAINYYTGEPVSIPLDTQLSPSENAKKYFEKYGKLKRTREALSELVVGTKNELEHLESIALALDIAETEADLVQIKEELMDYGYVKRKGNQKKQKNTAKPYHYLSSGGFHMYVGKNNYQNEELTFKVATGGDWWFHAKNAPGSHVIVKTEGKELDDRSFEEAAALAAFYSKVKEQDKVEVDYTLRKNVKKPAGGAPGFVVYYTNYSMIAVPKIEHLQPVKE